MFRDSHGVVHTVSAPDPLDDLPASAAAVLRSALLRTDEPGLDAAVERCEAVRDLLERWQDAFFAALPDEVDRDEEARWAAEAGLSLEELEAAYEEDDEDDDDEDPLLPLGEAEPEPDLVLEVPVDPRLDDELVGLLERELLLLPLRVRLEALVAATALVQTWADLLEDQEKLLGHLVLAHRQPQQVLGHEELARAHAALHAASPGHAQNP